MGRPLNKKYFGNRNIGRGGDQVDGNLSNSENYSDDKIGGEGIDSIAWLNQGSFMGNSNVQVLTALPAMPDPTIPGGVRATYTAQFEVESVTTGAGKTDLAVGDTFTWASVPGLIAKVTDITSGANALFSVTVAGASRGNALALADIPKDSQTITMTKSGGTGTATEFTVDVLFRVKASSVVITEKGSGYTGAESLVFTKPGTTVGQVPVTQLVLTTDSGTVGSATNQENAIIIHANTDDNGTKVGDIIKQTNGRSYKVYTADGIAICKLVADDSPSAGEAYIVATDYNGSTYWVTKLTAHRATLTRRTLNSSYLFTNGACIQWNFSGDEDIVSIENA